MIQKRRTKGGEDRWVVRWYEAGRAGARRTRTFDREKDAVRFETAVRRAQQLGQLASEVIGSEQLLEEFIDEWWDKYATAYLRPGTLATYAAPLDVWIVPYLGKLRLRDISRETVDAWVAGMQKKGAGAPTINRALGVLQGIFRRAVEWRRVAANPVAGAPRLAHARSSAIEARTPELVERIRGKLGRADAALVSVLAYQGLRPGEAFALEWRDLLDHAGRPRKRIQVRRALSDRTLAATKSGREREPELFAPVAAELAELYLAGGRPPLRSLVFPDTAGGHLRRQNWRNRVWKPALEKVQADLAKHGQELQPFRPYDLRHTCATLLIYEGRTVNEVAQHLGHADPGMTARVYTHTFDDARKRRRVPIQEAIRRARRGTRAEEAKV